MAPSPQNPTNSPDEDQDVSSREIECNRTHHSDFLTTPWARALLESPTYTRFPFASRDLSYNPTSDIRTFGLLRHTFATSNTIRSFICLRHSTLDAAAAVERATTPQTPASSAVAAPDAATEVLCLISLGTPALDGWPGILHGGVIALLLDEALSVAAEVAFGNVDMRTAWLRTEYKREVPTPCVLLGRASAKKTEGRKSWLSGQLEDGEGRVYATGEALFIKTRPSGSAAAATKL